MSDFILAARDNNLPVISKIGELNRGEAARLLEAGAVGVQLPRTESREQLIDYMKFPPVGTRAGAPCYGNVDYVFPDNDAKWLRQADASVAVVAHIETQKGYENIEEIVSTPIVDMVYLGTYDFSISMGHPGEYEHPTVKKGIAKVLAACKKHGVPFGTTASGPAAAKQWVKKGCRFFEIIDELTMIKRVSAETVDAYHKFC